MTEPLSQEQRKGYAGQLVTNPLWAVLIEEMKQAALTRWASSNPDQGDLREDCWREYTAIQKLENLVNNSMEGENTGE